MGLPLHAWLGLQPSYAAGAWQLETVYGFIHEMLRIVLNELILSWNFFDFCPELLRIDSK